MMALATGHQQIPKDFHLSPEVALRLVPKAAVGAHHLDGDRSVLGQLPGPEDLSHTAAANPFLDQIVGMGLRELHTPRLAILAQPDSIGVVAGSIGDTRRRPRHRILDGGPFSATRAGCHVFPVTGSLGEMHDERAVTGRDHVPLAELNPLDAQSVNLRPVRAPQIDEVAQWWLILDPEVFARQEQVLRHREMHARRPAHHERLSAVNEILLTRVGA